VHKFSVTYGSAGYDRVMFYYFHEDQHGEVLAARSKHGVESYGGLHWPATDLPQFSRNILLKNNEPRIIVDASAKTANILMVSWET
jgi:light-regulated signal transduction histidine kinase (bacteriophytochrome)